MRFKTKHVLLFNKITKYVLVQMFNIGRAFKHFGSYSNVLEKFRGYTVRSLPPPRFTDCLLIHVHVFVFVFIDRQF